MTTTLVKAEPCEDEAPQRLPLLRAHMYPRATTPRSARDYTRQALDGTRHSSLTDDAQSVVSELVTNACQAVVARYGEQAVCCQCVLLALYSADGGLLIEVTDSVPGSPLPREADPDDENGRGLFIVEALSESWGSRCEGDTKTIFALLADTPATLAAA